jgi:FkbM family methyltransferase
MGIVQKIFIKLRNAGKQLAEALDGGQAIYNQRRNKERKITNGKETFVFSIPNRLCLYRAETFFSKEPETLGWIDGFAAGDVFWDIGANVGLYSIYAAKKGVNVYAFEPSVFNLEVLARNIHLNKLADAVSILPVALSDTQGFGLMNMSSKETGGALSTFDKSYGFDGKPLKIVFNYKILSLTGNDAITNLGIPLPDHIKIDVDGIEHLILAGAATPLASARSVLIEVSRDFKEQKEEIFSLMEKAGLVLKQYSADEMEHYHISDNAPTANLIWVRK